MKTNIVVEECESELKADQSYVTKGVSLNDIYYHFNQIVSIARKLLDYILVDCETEFLSKITCALTEPSAFRDSTLIDFPRDCVPSEKNIVVNEISNYIEPKSPLDLFIVSVPDRGSVKSPQVLLTPVRVADSNQLL